MEEEILMKKKLLSILILIGITLFSTSCSKTAATQTDNDYDMDEFIEIWEKVCSDVDEETEYWTEDKQIAENYRKEYVKAGKKYGLNKGDKITLRGMVYDTFNDGFLLSEKDASKLENGRFILCNLNNGKQLFLKGEIVEVTGILFDDTWGIGNCEIIAPDTSSIKFENNVDYALEEQGTITDPILIEGTVSDIKTIDDFISSSETPYIDDIFAANYDYSTSIGTLKNQDGTKSFTFFVDEERGQKISTGDNIAFLGYITHSYITSEVYSKMMTYYIFE